MITNIKKCIFQQLYNLPTIHFMHLNHSIRLVSMLHTYNKNILFV